MKYAVGVVLLGLCVGCARPQWPEPPAVDQAEYQRQYQSWLGEQQNTARESSIIVGIWSLSEGETAFGSDRALPIVLPHLDLLTTSQGGLTSEARDAVTAEGRYVALPPRSRIWCSNGVRHTPDAHGPTNWRSHPRKTRQRACQMPHIRATCSVRTRSRDRLVPERSRDAIRHCS